VIVTLPPLLTTAHLNSLATSIHLLARVATVQAGVRNNGVLLQPPPPPGPAQQTRLLLSLKKKKCYKVLLSLPQRVLDTSGPNHPHDDFGAQFAPHHVF
jgi:hypothetical protein